MARALKKPQPKSSVERYFDQTSLDAALDHIDEEVTTPSLVDLQTYIQENSDGAPPPEPITLEPTVTTSAAKSLRPTVVPKREQVAPKEVSRSRQQLRPKEFLLARNQEEVLRQVKETLAQETGADLSASHILRALLLGLVEALPSVRRELSRLGPINRPPNGAEHEHEREQLEHRLKEAMMRGIRG